MSVSVPVCLSIDTILLSLSLSVYTSQKYIMYMCSRSKYPYIDWGEIHLTWVVSNDWFSVNRGERERERREINGLGIPCPSFPAGSFRPLEMKPKEERERNYPTRY